MPKNVYNMVAAQWNGFKSYYFLNIRKCISTYIQSRNQFLAFQHEIWRLIRNTPNRKYNKVCKAIIRCFCECSIQIKMTLANGPWFFKKWLVLSS